MAADDTAVAPVAQRPAPAAEMHWPMTPIGIDEADPVIKAACCKVRRKGNACGNSCISRKKTCHKPPGCACDAK